MTPNGEQISAPEASLEEDNSRLEIQCFYDAPLPESQIIEMFVLPVLQSGSIQARWAEVQGLLVQRIDGGPKTSHYRRIGMFEMYRFELKKFMLIPKEEAFFLI